MARIRIFLILIFTLTPVQIYGYDLLANEGHHGAPGIEGADRINLIEPGFKRNRELFWVSSELSNAEEKYGIFPLNDFRSFRINGSFGGGVHSMRRHETYDEELSRKLRKLKFAQSFVLGLIEDGEMTIEEVLKHTI